MSEAKQAIREFCDKNDLAIGVKFVPWSQSRSAKPNPKFRDYNLNWRIFVTVRGNEILQTDYSAGIAHCPSYKQGMRDTLHNERIIKAECETGRAHHWSTVMNSAVETGWGRGKSALPDTVDVVASLAMDSDVLDYSSFDDWAANYGYDSDSRKAEAIYRVCLDIALKLRNALGDAKLTELRELAHQY